MSRETAGDNAQAGESLRRAVEKALSDYTERTGLVVEAMAWSPICLTNHVGEVVDVKYNIYRASLTHGGG